METLSKPVRSAASNLNPHRNTGAESGSIHVIVPEGNVDEFIKVANKLFEVDAIQKQSTKSGMSTLQVMWSSGDGYFAINNKLSEIATNFGGDIDIPF